MIQRLTLAIGLLWLPSLFMSMDQFENFFYWRHQLTMLTGFLGLAYMVAAVLLAARFNWLEHYIKGLDKGYALHKDLGIAATISLVAHWLIIKIGVWLVEAEIIARPNRGAPPEIEGINWHAVAEQVGDISFKVFLIFSIISLVQAISYKKFRFTHKIGGLLVIAGVFHSMLLLDWNITSMPMNIAISIASVVGVWCAWLSLSGRIGKDNKATGEVLEVQPFSIQADSHMLVRFSIQLKAPIQYKEGQFAYLNFHDGESPHPFSILNYDHEKLRVDFAVKDLGDYTKHLVNKLKAGDKVTVEGSYGRFQISDYKTQVWVGAGIGIVPFISRLYWLKKEAVNQGEAFDKIHLFYCVNSKKEAFFETEIVAILDKLSFIELHLLDAEKGELLTTAQILQRVNNQTFDVSFCGPMAFGDQLKASLVATGLASENFHQELFKMR